MRNYLFILLALLMISGKASAQLPDSKLAESVRNTVWPRLESELHNKNFKNADQIFIRLFKEEHILEIWVKDDAQYHLFKTYPICYFSGGLGTKTHVNDGKSPEGFYTITAKQLNPVSNYHLAINIGYPNPVEKAKGYTGTDIMIHGHCASIGCYAMTDPLIEEIYTMVYKALEAGQKSIPLHIFPFRLNANNMKICAASDYFSFWNNMKMGYDLFESSHTPPMIYATGKVYAYK